MRHCAVPFTLFALFAGGHRSGEDSQQPGPLKRENVGMRRLDIKVESWTLIVGYAISPARQGDRRILLTGKARHILGGPSP